MQFSVITASFNSAKTIADCLTSIFNQTYPDIEHIVIDGGSSDNSMGKINSVPNRVTKLFSEEDNGIYDALNKGINNSGGDVIGILHSDDILASDKIIEEVNNKFLETSADIVYGDLDYVNQKDTNIVIRHWKSNPFDGSLIKKGWMPAHPAMFVRRNIFKKYGLYDLQYRISSDYDLMLRFMQNKDIKFVYLPIVITKMRMGGASNRSFKNIFLKSLEDYRIIKKNGLPYPFVVLLRKNISKLSQFFLKNKN
jgi:glycosyltransferase involved in cell wall biosynthesis